MKTDIMLNADHHDDLQYVVIELERHAMKDSRPVATYLESLEDVAAPNTFERLGPDEWEAALTSAELLTILSQITIHGGKIQVCTDDWEGHDVFLIQIVG